MDFIIEAFLEIFFDGFISYSKTKKAPKIFRYFVLTFLLGVFALLLYFSYLLRDEGYIMVFMAVLSFFVITYAIKLKSAYKKLN